MISSEPEPLDVPGLVRCPSCGGKTFEWGAMVAYFPMWFVNDGAEGEPPPRYFTTGKETRARVCKRCGNVQFFISLE